MFLHIQSTAKTLTGDNVELARTGLEESQVPEAIEQIIEELLAGLEDRVWSTNQSLVSS